MVSEGESPPLIRRISDFHRSCVRTGISAIDSLVPPADHSARCNVTSSIRINRRIKPVESQFCGQVEKFPNILVERENACFPSRFPKRGRYPS